MNPVTSDCVAGVLYFVLHFAANNVCLNVILIFSLVSKFPRGFSRSIGEEY